MEPVWCLGVNCSTMLVRLQQRISCQSTPIDILEVWVDGFAWIIECALGSMESAVHAYMQVPDHLRPCMCLNHTHRQNQTRDFIYIIDNGEYAIGIYLDLKKAFDTVNHDILLKKLEHYGIRGQANTLISNYLTNGNQYCIVNGRNSSIGSFCTGVPQGSVLGPHLFLLYINDIASSMTDENLILFADDTSILLHDKNLKSLIDKAKSSLTKIQSWFLTNKLSLSIEKSQYIVYRSSKRKLTVRAVYIKINGSKFNRVKEVEYLGLTLDENMNWRTHINKLCSNEARYFSVFFNIRSYMPEKLRKTFYYAFIYSRIQYGIEVYGSAAKTIINQLCVTQNKLLKVLFNKHYWYHTNNLYRELKLLKSEDIFNSLLLQFVRCTVRNNCPEPFKDYFKTK